MTIFHRIMNLAVGALIVGMGLPVHADVGTVTQLSGTLSAKRADGTLRILSQKSEVRQGDTLTTERDTYGQIQFSDGGQLTLKPNTTIEISSLRFEKERPQDSSFLVGLIKGGLRAVTGLIGRTNPNQYGMNTETATIGIRGTTYGVDDCVNSSCGDLAAAVYVKVSDGEIVVRNDSGEEAYKAGQFGMIEKGKRPVFLSTDPGLALTPPASFFLSVLGRTAVNAGKDDQCIVGR